MDETQVGRLGRRKGDTEANNVNFGSDEGASDSADAEDDASDVQEGAFDARRAPLMWMRAPMARMKYLLMWI